GRHHTSHRVAAPIECKRLSDDSGIGTESLPKRVRDHYTGIVVEPPAENRSDAKLPDKRQCDHDSIHVVRLAGESQCLSRVAKPSECVEDPSTLFIRTRVIG